ncbi:MAG: CBS domain-containing protein [Nitrospinota bacterium]
MSVGNICNRSVVVTRREAGILEAADLMRGHHVGNLVVVDEGGGQPLPVCIQEQGDGLLITPLIPTSPEGLMMPCTTPTKANWVISTARKAAFFG